MWIRISLVLLSTFVVSGLSFPNPDDAAYKIPEVGTGQRSQYYVLHSDGTFKYGFDSGDGGFESVKSRTPGSREGKFGYVDPDGNTIKLEYEAGEGGFVARGDHLPKPSPELARALASVVRSNTPFVDPLASSRSDASYGFRFDSEDHARNEKSDAEGTVTGSYSYVDENGIKRNFNYRAGKGIGFVIEGDGLTQDVNVPAIRQYQDNKNQQPGVRSRNRASFRSSSQRAQTSSIPSGGGVRTHISPSVGEHHAPVVFRKSENPFDASYSFSYDAGDHSRSEKSDGNLNVNGKFSFVADDGKEREVTYVAGSATGFQAEGDHLPKAPESDFGDRLSSASQRGSYSGQRTGSARRIKTDEPLKTQTSNFPEISRGYKFQTRSGLSHGQQGASISSAGSTSRQRESQLRQVSPSSGSLQTNQRDSPLAAVPRTFVHSHPGQRERANVRSSQTPGGQYSFSYDTSSHSRSESGDRNNNVEGNFAFIADDGQRREIRYEAGSDTGFIAEGAHIPVGPVVPGAPSGQPTGRIVPVPSVRFVDPLADSDSDASYKFEFDSDTYSRTESADEDGNVVGTYTVVNEDGTRVTYRFRAGKGIGFEQEEISRTQGPRPAAPVPYTGPLAGDISGSTHGHSVAFGGPLSRVYYQRDQQSHGQRITPSKIPVTNAFHAPSGQASFRQGHAATGTGTEGSYTSSAVDRSSGQASFRQGHAATGTGTHGSYTSSAAQRSSLSSPSSSNQVFPGFILHKYDQTPTSEKFGYVLKFDN